VYVALLAALERLEVGALPGPLRLCICGGAPLNAALQERWEQRTGIPLRQGYGLTEAGPVALFDGPPSPGRPGVLGMPPAGVRVSIRDPQTSVPLEPGITGEICIAGDSLFSGYVGGATTGLAVREGWLHSGDLGTMDRSGAVTFGGVRKAMFTHNGFNIYPREIEQAVMELPGVASATVEAVPSEAHGSDIHLTVIGTPTEPEIAAWCLRRLSAYKQPPAIFVSSGQSA
jgi:long-chain acyl-CoA synthetase